MKVTKFVTLALFLAAAVTACSSDKSKSESTKAEKEVRTVRTMRVENEAIDRTLSYTATLIPFEELNYAPAQPGRINKIHVEVGDRVKKGQTLVEMDRTQLTQAMLQLEDARTMYSRMDTLRKLNSISEQQYDQAKTAYDLATSNVKHLQENTTLTAPFSGIVTAKYYEDGEIYSGAPNPQTGKAAIITLMQIEPMKAMVYISEKYYPDLKKGMKATITSDIYSGEQFEGSVFKVYPTIEQSTRTFVTEVKIANPDEKLRPGMFVRVALELKTDKTIMVPAIAVLKQEGTNNRYIFVNENNVARRIDVAIGDRVNDKIEVIADDFTVGKELIIAGQAKLMDNDPITVARQ
ncbi:MAG: efflux RND transporter periplasmic adaptor subunit [Bacteroidales bacterium]|jgi:RND family efflux transporter MFP subunit|nr:efflux RND transporter periplasmic adaptor subunit [Bacteroidales bacterium]